MPKNSTLTKTISINENAVIKWGNALVSGRWNTTLIEFRLLIALTSQIDKGLNDFECYEASVTSLGKMMRLDSNSYRDIKKIADSLSNKSVKFLWKPTPNSKNSWIKTPWFSLIAYNDATSTLLWKFNPDLIPMLLNLRKAYVRSDALPMMNFRSSYAGRWYLLAKQWKKLGAVIMTIDDLKQSFDLEGKYKYFKDFFRDVVVVPIKEVNAQSDLILTVNPIKTGRRYTHLKFVVKSGADSEPESDTQVII